MLTAQKLIAMGFAGKRVGEILKQSKTWTKEQTEEFLNTGLTPKVDSVKMTPGTVWHWLCNHPAFTGFRSASNSEKLRWLNDGSVIINDELAEPDDLILSCIPLRSLVFFPSSQNKVTML